MVSGGEHTNQYTTDAKTRQQSTMQNIQDQEERTPLKTEMFSGKVISSYNTSCTHRATCVKIQ
jgi:hypothetical protein